MPVLDAISSPEELARMTNGESGKDLGEAVDALSRQEISPYILGDVLVLLTEERNRLREANQSLSKQLAAALAALEPTDANVATYEAAAFFDITEQQDLQIQQKNLKQRRERIRRALVAANARMKAGAK